MMDKRIGTRNTEKNTWPEQTVSGASYTRKEQLSTISLGRGYFAVKDAKPVKNEDALILELQEIVRDLTAPKLKASKDASNG
jgi:hypothetical protein